MLTEHYDDHAYDETYHAQLERIALESARVVVPILLRHVRPASVLDVGCGNGAWLKVFQENGVATVRGVDGASVNPARLLIDRECFQALDLCRPFELEGRYDLACCLEVAEHLPHKLGPTLIRNLTRAAPLVLFSAAVPGQGGTHHVNEQWPAYWRAEFARHGFQRLDPLRREILHDQRVAWWYRQNLFLYASAEALAALPHLAEEARAAEAEFELIHVYTLEHLSHIYRYRSLSGILREIPRVAWDALCRRLRRGTRGKRPT